MKKHSSPFIAALSPSTHHKSSQNHTSIPLSTWPYSHSRFPLQHTPCMRSKHPFFPPFPNMLSHSCPLSSLRSLLPCAPCLTPSSNIKTGSFLPLLFPFYRTLPLLNAAHDPFLARLILVLPSSRRFVFIPSTLSSPSFKAISVLR